MDNIIITLIPPFLFLILIYLYYQLHYQHWKKRKIHGPKPIIPFGNYPNIFEGTTSLHEYLKRIYDNLKPQGHKYCGIYVVNIPVCIFLDPELVKSVLKKDFDHFSDRGLYYNERDDPLTAGLLTFEKDKWKQLRNKVTPAFTHGKMKLMFGHLINSSENMLVAMKELWLKPIDIKGLAECFTADVVGSCIFGIECNCFTEKGTDFKKNGERIFKVTLFEHMVFFCLSRNKEFFRMLGITIVPKGVTEFFIKIIESIIKYREENGVIRKDFLQILIDMRAEDKDSLTVNEIVAECYLFFSGGFETTSSAISFSIYEMAKHEHVQDRVRIEIEEFLKKYNGEITYENIKEIKYLDQVISETLRLHPPVPTLPRICTKDYELPDGGFLEKGAFTLIPAYALQRDPELFPNPDNFDPERFNEENKANRSIYLSFGDGPRMCIGQRFGLLQAKIAIMTLLRKYKFALNPATKYPVEYAIGTPFISTKTIIWLDAVNIAK